MTIKDWIIGALIVIGVLSVVGYILRSCGF